MQKREPAQIEIGWVWRRVSDYPEDVPSSVYDRLTVGKLKGVNLAVYATREEALAALERAEKEVGGVS